MIRVNLSFDNLPLTVFMHNDGEPMTIECDGLDVEKHLTEEAVREIYCQAWEEYNDPNNEADARRER
jgi:hypothetical protein